MVSFRKFLMVVALLALCAGLVSAQVVNDTVTAILRSEGVTEPVNPIVISSIFSGTAAGTAAVTGTYQITLFSTSVGITSFPGTAADGSDNEIQLTANGVKYPGTVAPGGASVMFKDVKILSDFVIGVPPTNTFAFTISGIRVNASALASGGPILASGVSFTLLAQPADTASPAGLFAGSPIYTVANAAFPIPTFGFDVNRNVTGTGTAKASISFAQCDTTSSLLATPTATTPTFPWVFSVIFSEGFSKSFQTMHQEGGKTAADDNGVATNGTRLSATFSGFPAGTQLWVPITTSSVADPTKQATATLANLILEPNPDGSGGEKATISSTPTKWVAVTAGTPVVYEITQAFPNATETVEVPVAVSFVAGTTPSLSAATVGTVSGNYAPQSTVPGPSATAPIPRFNSTAKTANGFFGIVACSTSLLFPYVTTQPGWNVGIAISNTGADPFGNTGIGGTCDFSFYGAAGAPATPKGLGANGFGDTADRTPIASGTTAADVASTAVGTGVSFTGYAIAVCNFQFAHGYAFIIGNGAKSTLSNGYLALVLGGSDSLTRSGAPAKFEITGN